MRHDYRARAGIRQGDFVGESDGLKPREKSRCVCIVVVSMQGVCLFEGRKDCLGLCHRQNGVDPGVWVELPESMVYFQRAVRPVFKELIPHSMGGLHDDDVARVYGRKQSLFNPRLEARPVVDEDTRFLNGHEVTRGEVDGMEFRIVRNQRPDANMVATDLLGKVGQRIEGCHYRESVFIHVWDDSQGVNEGAPGRGNEDACSGDNEQPLTRVHRNAPTQLPLINLLLMVNNQSIP